MSKKPWNGLPPFEAVAHLVKLDLIGSTGDPSVATFSGGRWWTNGTSWSPGGMAEIAEYVSALGPIDPPKWDGMPRVKAVAHMIEGIFGAAYPATFVEDDRGSWWRIAGHEDSVSSADMHARGWLYLYPLCNAENSDR